MMRHGPHHGAQKSTRTGLSASSTSAWKLLSVTSSRLPATAAPVRRWCAPGGASLQKIGGCGLYEPRPLASVSEVYSPHLTFWLWFPRLAGLTLAACIEPLAGSHLTTPPRS